jgi:hypothetical protein
MDTGGRRQPRSFFPEEGAVRGHLSPQLVGRATLQRQRRASGSVSALGGAPAPGRQRARPEPARRRREGGGEPAEKGQPRRRAAAAATAAQLGSPRVSAPRAQSGRAASAAGMQPSARRGRRLALPALLALLTCSAGKWRAARGALASRGPGDGPREGTVGRPGPASPVPPTRPVPAAPLHARSSALSRRPGGTQGAPACLPAGPSGPGSAARPGRASPRLLPPGAGKRAGATPTGSGRNCASNCEKLWKRTRGTVPPLCLPPPASARPAPRCACRGTRP